MVGESVGCIRVPSEFHLGPGTRSSLLPDAFDLKTDGSSILYTVVSHTPIFLYRKLGACFFSTSFALLTQSTYCTRLQPNRVGAKGWSKRREMNIGSRDGSAASGFVFKRGKSAYLRSWKRPAGMVGM